MQSDVKTSLAFASLTQVGIITAEIGLGLPRYIPLIHIIGHACLRTLQLVRAPTLLHDYHQLENAIGDHLHAEPSGWERFIPASWRLAIYRMSLERGFLDALIDEYFVRPFILLFRWCDAMERRSDDTPETLAHRLSVYYKNTAPLIDFYRHQGKLKTVDGMLPIENVTSEINAILDGVKV